MSTKLLVGAAVLPVSLKTALRYCHALPDEVDLVALNLKAAVATVEDYTGRCLITQTFLQQVSEWPHTAQLFRPGGWPHSLVRAILPRVRFMSVERSPLISVTSLNYYPADGTAQVTINPTNYRVDVATLPGRITFVDGFKLPDVAIRFDAIELTYTAGTGTSANTMNNMLNVAVLQLTRHAYDHATAVDDSGKLVEMPFATRHYLRAMRIEA